MREHKACNSCGAPVFWARTSSGGRMPIDAEPVEGGNITLYEDAPGGQAPQAVVIPPGETKPTIPGLGEPEGPRYVSHFATCPSAAEHRKRPVPKQT